MNVLLCNARQKFFQAWRFTGLLIVKRLNRVHTFLKIQKRNKLSNLMQFLFTQVLEFLENQFFD